MLLIFVHLLGAELTLAALTTERYSIPCKAQSVQGVQYRKISWYKVIGSEYQGLVMRNLRDNQTRVYQGANHSYELGEENALLLPPSALSDCGTYQCTLWPPLGHRIQEGQYQYYPAGCVRPTEPLPIMSLCAAHSSCCEVRSLVTWGIPAALLILTVSLGSMLSLRHPTRKSKLADTI